MEYVSIEKRQSRRFVIPGATASYEIRDSTEELSSVIDMSRVGLKLLSNNPIEINSELIIDISIPNLKYPLTFWGRVRWFSFNERIKKYIIGIEFNPFGEQKGQNYPDYLENIFALEQQFSKPSRYKTEIIY